MWTKPVNFSSTNVLRAAYEDQEHTLEVVYKHKNGREPIYHYFHVPPDVWYGILNAVSKGSFVWEELRAQVSRYPYEIQNYSKEDDVLPEPISNPDSKKPRDSWWNRFRRRR